MLRLREPLMPAAKYLLVYSLEGAEDELADFEVDDWEAQFPRSAACFSIQLARTTISDLRGKLERPERYQPLDSHGLLIYEVLRLYVAILNDDQIAEVNQQLLTLASKGDGYLQFRRKRRPPLTSPSASIGLSISSIGIPIFMSRQRSTSSSIRGRNSRRAQIYRRLGHSR